MKDRQCVQCVQCGSVVQVLSDTSDVSMILPLPADGVASVIYSYGVSALPFAHTYSVERKREYMSDDPINLRAYIMASRFNGIDLDGCSVLLGLKREPDENDSVFRSRILSKIRQKYDREKETMRVIKDGMGR